MDSIEAKGDWEAQKGKLKKKIAVLAGNEQLFLEGENAEMLEKLQLKLGKTKEEVQKIITAL